jgi:thiosulfate/3-mercaptopyruvate sulfurtransferase
MTASGLPSWGYETVQGIRRIYKEDTIEDFYSQGNAYLTGIEQTARLIREGRVRLIDTREPERFLEGHLPGAVNMFDIFTYMATGENGGYQAMARFFSERLGEAGMTGRERVIVYEDAMDNGYGRSCRGYFLLRYLGHRDVTVMHGGLQAWLEAGLGLTREIAPVQKGEFRAETDDSIILTKEEMLAGLSDPEVIVLDGRDRAEWMGVTSSPYGPDFAPRKGRIPGAAWIEWYDFMHQDGPIPWFKSPDELRTVLAGAGIGQDRTVHLYCFKGARTCAMFIAFKLAGFDKVRNYFGSWNEWSRDPSLPIEQGYPRKSCRGFRGRG